MAGADLPGTKKKTYTVRCVVEGRQFQQTLTSRKLADSFRSEMLTAVNDGRALRPARGRLGSLRLVGSTQRLSSVWSEATGGREDSGPKHRSGAGTRIVPTHAELVQLLRHHIDSFGVDARGHLFTAEWAGHSVHVLLKVYAKCLYGQEDAAKERIAQALGEDPGAARGP
jgi:hypothetical protein